LQTLTDTSNADALHTHNNIAIQQAYTVGKSGADFTTIQGCIDAISDAATDKRYACLVYPGDYAETITGKSYVEIIGLAAREAVNITGATGPLYTFPDDEGHIFGLKFTLTPTTAAQEIISIPATVNARQIISNCLFTVTSASDVASAVFDVDGGEAEILLSKIVFTNTNTATGAIKTQRIWDIDGNAKVELFRNIVDVDISSIEDRVVVYDDNSTTGGKTHIENNIIRVNANNAGNYTGLVRFIAYNGVTVTLHVNKNTVVLESSEAAGGTGKGTFIRTSSAGSAEVRSAANTVFVSGFDANYWADVNAAGDTVYSHMDTIRAADGDTGAGSVVYASSLDDGDFSASGTITGATIVGANVTSVANPGHTHDYAQVSLTNKAGASTVVGYVYRLDPDNAESFDYGSDHEDARVAVATSVIANNAAGDMIISGVVDVYVDATVTIGQQLYFGTTSGQAVGCSCRKDGAWGRTIEARAGAGLVKAVITPVSPRKWGILEEPTWEHVLSLPVFTAAKVVKDDDNPIIAPDGAGTDWNADHTLTPSVIINDETVRVYCAGYYAAHATAHLRYRIGMFSSPIETLEDGTFVEDTVNSPMIVADQAWEQAGASLGVYAPAVIYDATAPNTGYDYTWKMIYSGAISVNGSSAIGYAYSSDGDTWTKLPVSTACIGAGNPNACCTGAGTGCNPIIVHDDGGSIHIARYPATDWLKVGEQYYLWYRDLNNEIALLRADDPEDTWAYIGQVLSLGVAAWDSQALGFVHVYHDSGNIYGTYAGQSAGDPQGGLAVTTLASLITDTATMTKIPWNPVLTTSTPGTGAWDNQYHYGGGAIFRKGIDLFGVFDADDTVSSIRQIGLWKLDF
jgi:hypothetical protein